MIIWIGGKVLQANPRNKDEEASATKTKPNKNKNTKFQNHDYYTNLFDCKESQLLYFDFPSDSRNNSKQNKNIDEIDGLTSYATMTGVEQ